MKTPATHEDIEKLLEEAAALIESVNSAFREDVEDIRAVEFERRLNRLKERSARMKDGLSAGKGTGGDTGSRSEGSREACRQIVEALGDLTAVLS